MNLTPEAFSAPRRSLGLGGRMFLAFGITSALVLAAAVVGWFGYAEIAGKQRLIVNDALPGMIEAQTLAETNAHIFAAAPSLATTDNEPERRALYEQLRRQTGALNTMLADIARYGFDADRMNQLKTTVGRISDNLAKQNTQVARRIGAQHHLTASTERVRSAAVELSDIAGSLVANAATTTTAVISSLYDMGETPAQRDDMFDAFDRLVEVDVDSLERMFELRLNSADLIAQVDQLFNQTEVLAINGLERRYRELLETVARRIRDINDPGRRAQAIALSIELTQAVGTPTIPGIFELQRRVQSADFELMQLDVRNRTLSTDLNAIVANLVIEATGSINKATAAADEAVRRGRIIFTLSAMITLLFVGLILWLYVHRTVVRRITALDSAMRMLADGNYTVEVDTSGSDELTKMARTVQVFRRSALEKLALERERTQISSELQRHKQSLERLVEQRTAELREANARLADEVSQHDLARQSAEQANRSKTTFLATMSHEIRTPMSGVLGTLQLLRDESLSPAQHRRVELVMASGRSLLGILNDVLDYAMVEANQQRIESARFDLHQLTEEMVSLMTPAAHDKDLQLITRIDPDTPRWLNGAPGQLRQILLNLLGNAIKFTESGHITVHIRPIATDDASHIHIRFDVIDTGIGVPSHMRDSVFEAFTQMDSSLSRRYGGAGLGLAISKRLATSMGGQIGLEGAPENGTTAWCLLPFLPIKGAPVSPDNGIVAKPASPTRALTLLLVDDDDVNRMVTSAFLESAGHLTIAVCSGELALEALVLHVFDVVLMDISMPGMDGLETLRRIRGMPGSCPTRVPVVAMSAHVFREEIDRFLASGMDGFIAKPVDPDVLMDTLSSVIHSNSETEGQPLPSKHRPVAASRIYNEHDESILNRRFLEQDVTVLGEVRVKHFIDVFLASSESTVERLIDAVKNERWSDVAASAHHLKGASASVGLVSLHDHAQAVEQTVEEASVRLPGQSIDSLVAQLIVLHRRSCSVLSAVSLNPGNDGIESNSERDSLRRSRPTLQL